MQSAAPGQAKAAKTATTFLKPRFSKTKPAASKVRAVEDRLHSLLFERANAPAIPHRRSAAGRPYRSTRNIHGHIVTP